MRQHHRNMEGRVLSLDVFRGLTIAGMILVNNPGSWEDAFGQLRHAAWHGWTVTDLIFPFFLWIVGFSLVLSSARRRERGATGRALALHVVRRSVIIFLLGLVVNGFPFGLLWDVSFSWSSLRIPGVLQRIAICYAVSSLFVLRWDGVRDRLLAIGGLLAAYWLAMLLVPVPGYGPGVLDPEGNLCRFIDMRVLGSHTWEFAPAEGFDPEGILSTIPAIATTLFGTLAGSWLRSGRAPSRTATGFAAAGVVLVLGGALADIWFPINKNLWTSSYVLFTAGCASVAFALLYWVVDVLGWQRWSHPFRVFGSNALSVFVGSELLATLLWIVPVSVAGQEGLTLHDFLYGRYFFPLGSPPVVSLIFAIVFVVFLYMFAWVFWKRRWIIKI